MFFFFKFNPYIAIIGDIKNSKNIKERNILQKKLDKILNEVNEIYSDSISSKFIITLGDEFQGLLHSGKNLMEIIYYIKKEQPSLFFFIYKYFKFQTVPIHIVQRNKLKHLIQ